MPTKPGTSMGILRARIRHGCGNSDGGGAHRQNADYGDKFMGLSVLALVMVFLSVASLSGARCFVDSAPRKSHLGGGSSASDSAAAADDRNTASNFPVGGDGTPSKTRHEDAQSRGCITIFAGSSVACFLTSVSCERSCSDQNCLVRCVHLPARACPPCLPTPCPISCGHRRRLRWPSLLVDSSAWSRSLRAPALCRVSALSHPWSHRLDLRLQGLLSCACGQRVFLS